MAHYTLIRRDEGHDLMANYPGFGEMRFLTPALQTEQVAVTWRVMPEGTGGKGSYGHRHKTQEEVLYLISGRLQVKVDDEVLDLEPGMAIRFAPEVVRSVHNEGPGEAELILVSQKGGDPGGDTEQVQDFWPE
jgi:mannose-6-phosphate isomerase-like protein (cupin superfamily)